MCGLAGETRFDGGVTAAPLHDISAKLRHRGPDDHGLWLSEDRCCGFSFRRLSVLDLSSAGHQPMIDPETGNAIVFNGQIYNFQALRRECQAAGDRFRSRTDTEVLLALYRRYGENCLKHLRGMYAFAIWNKSKRELFFARDRVGKKPFHYAITKAGMAFCSEIRPLSRHPLVSRHQDPAALELYLQLECIPAPWTIYRQIRKLPPAHFGVLSSVGLRIEKYWDINYEPKNSLNDDEAVDGLDEALTEAVRLRMIADVPLGALLSGGVDSSLILGIMAKLTDKPVQAFSIGFEDKDFNELPYAKDAARLCNAEHHPVIVTDDVAAMLPLVVRHYGEPYADSSAIPSFLICRAARRSLTVVLNGDGGDELLGGYSRYALSPSALAMSSALSRVIPRTVVVSALQHMDIRQHAGRGAFGSVCRHLFHGEMSRIFNFHLWGDSELRRLRGGTDDDEVTRQYRRRWLSIAVEHSTNPIDLALYLDNHTYLADDLLVKMDIAAMHVGLEARSPLLDHKVIEYCALLPMRMKVRNSTTKYLLKLLAEKMYPKSLVHRSKQGFAVPLAKWLRGPLRDEVHDTLFDRSLMTPFDPSVIAQTLAEFFSDATNDGHKSRIWSLFMFGQWLKHSERAG
jgi:asparagine synthase (glutamine-hydrolysing)